MHRDQFVVRTDSILSDLDVEPLTGIVPENTRRIQCKDQNNGKTCKRGSANRDHVGEI